MLAQLVSVLYSIVDRIYIGNIQASAIWPGGVGCAAHRHLLSSFASLLIPKIAKEREQDHRRAVAHITGKAVRLALAFGMFFSGVFLLFGGQLGHGLLPQRGRRGLSASARPPGAPGATWTWWWTAC